MVAAGEAVGGHPMMIVVGSTVVSQESQVMINSLNPYHGADNWKVVCRNYFLRCTIHV